MQAQGLRAELIAPCGMNCAVCSGYQALLHHLPKKRGKISHCLGCRSRGKECAYLKGHCKPLKSGSIRSCYQCLDFPCARLSTLDERYRRNYQASPIANLREIQAIGLDVFLQHQGERYSCPRCGGLVCLHNGKCYHCETVESWRG